VRLCKTKGFLGCLTSTRVINLVESARRVSACSVNAVMTTTYWEIGRHIVDFEQRGKTRAEDGEAPLRKYDMA